MQFTDQQMEQLKNLFAEIQHPLQQKVIRSTFLDLIQQKDPYLRW